MAFKRKSSAKNPPKFVKKIRQINCSRLLCRELLTPCTSRPAPSGRRTGSQVPSSNAFLPSTAGKNNDWFNQCSVLIRFISASRIRIHFMERIRKRIQVTKNLPKSWKISTEINQNNKNIIHFFINIKLLFKYKNVYLINNKTDHFLQKYIFKKSFF